MICKFIHMYNRLQMIINHAADGIVPQKSHFKLDVTYIESKLFVSHCHIYLLLI